MSILWSANKLDEQGKLPSIGVTSRMSTLPRFPESPSLANALITGHVLLGYEPEEEDVGG